MRELLDLDRYPLDRPDSAEYLALVESCQAALEHEGLFSLEGFVRTEPVVRLAEVMQPLLDRVSFTHARDHNVYFLKEVAGLAPDHPALRTVRTVNHTLCGDHLEGTIVTQVYEWPPLVAFLARVMGREALYLMDDPLARLNVISYREGETLNWHFDRSHFTTTLLIQQADIGGEFQYRFNLRSDDDPNYAGVARVLLGQDEAVRTLPLAPGTLNVFKGKNTLHRVSPPRGRKDRIIAIFSYYDRPGVTFSREESLAFYGRAREA